MTSETNVEEKAELRVSVSSKMCSIWLVDPVQASQVPLSIKGATAKLSPQGWEHEIVQNVLVG